MLPHSLLLTGLRDLRRRPLQTGLMLLGIALGVAVVIAIDLANTSASRAFRLSTETVVGRATHQVRGGPRGVPGALYRQLRIDWGYRLSAPVVEGVVEAPDLDQQPLRLLGVDPLAEGPFRSYLSDTGGQILGLNRLLVEPGTVLVGAGLAGHYGLETGDSIRLRLADRFDTVTIAGLLQPGEAGNRRALDGLLLADIATAQELMGLAGTNTLSRIDLILTAQEAQRLAGQLPASLRLARASEQAETAAQLTEAFQLNLTALSLLALVVGMFLIYNTVMFSVVQRRRVLGTLRSLGVTGERLFQMIQAETAIVTGLGAVLGLGLGWLLGQGAVRLVTQTINDLYYVVTVRDAPLTLLSAIKGIGVGLGAGAIAALGPALEAANVEPVTLMRRSSLEDRARRWLPWLGGGGLILGLAGTALLLVIQRSLVASFAGLFLIVIGIALTVPLATISLMRLAGPVLFRLTGVLGRLAARTVVKAISRTSVAIAALMVAVSVTIGVSVMIASFRSTVVNWLDLTLVADVYISAPTPGGTRPEATLDPSIAAKAETVAGVAEVEAIRGVVVDSEFGPVPLTATDTQRRRSAALYRFASGDAEAIWRAMTEGAIIVSEPFAYRHNLPVDGATVTLRTATGERVFPVAAVYYDYSSDQGAILMAREVYQRYWRDNHLSGLAVYTRPETDPSQVADALRTVLSGSALQVQVNRALREQALAVFDRTFAITSALRLLAVVVAFIGVLSALMALQIERARELATLQALGLTSGQLWRLTLMETGLMGATAGLLALPTGFVLAVVQIYVINLRSFGWTIQMTVDPWVFVQAMAVSVTAAILAAVYPMWRLRQAPVAAVLKQD
ncbi:MAG: ABC transporter permease [Anaerolineales bacterium]|nr:ABC transporter permease [Anaerolineales bacterium]